MEYYFYTTLVGLNWWSVEWSSPAKSSLSKSIVFFFFSEIVDACNVLCVGKLYKIRSFSCHG